MRRKVGLWKMISNVICPRNEWMSARVERQKLFSSIFMHNSFRSACCLFLPFRLQTAPRLMTWNGVDKKTNFPRRRHSAKNSLSRHFLSFIYSSCSVINDIMYVHTFTIKTIYYINKGKIILRMKWKEANFFILPSHTTPRPLSLHKKTLFEALNEKWNFHSTQAINHKVVEAPIRIQNASDRDGEFYFSYVLRPILCLLCCVWVWKSRMKV